MEEWIGVGKECDLRCAMPELAEVEYYRRQWDAGIGQTVRAVELHGEKRIFRGIDTHAMATQLTGRKLLRSSARGKQMLFEFSGANWLGLHLGMTGKMSTEAADFFPDGHDHLVLRLTKRALVFRDPRQFGRVRFHHGKNAPDWWKAMAPDISSPAFSREFLTSFLDRHKKAPIKAVLLLQTGFPGIGNWMADEILWRAKIHPRTPSGELTRNQQATVFRATRFVARESLRIIGSDFSDPPKSWLLHERWKSTGNCLRDGTHLHREKIGGRTTAWCARCQKPEKSGRNINRKFVKTGRA